MDAMAAFMTQDDFLRALREHPEWRQAVRAEILGEEILSLPELVKENSKQIAALTELVKENSKQIAALTERMDLVDAQIAANSKQIAALTERMDLVDAQIAANSKQIAANSKQIAANSKQIAALTERTKVVENDIGELKGSNLESALVANPRRFLKRHRGIRSLNFDERYVISERLPDDERLEVDQLDAVLYADDPDSGEPLYIAVEASWTPSRHDLERARRRAEILATITRTPVVALVAYNKAAIDQRLVATARKMGVAMARKDEGVTVPAEPIVAP